MSQRKTIAVVVARRQSGSRVHRPEFGFAGIAADEAQAAGHQVRCAHAESRDVGKLLIAGDDCGFGQLIADKPTSRILGAGLLCDGASNLIHLFAHAITQNQTAAQLAATEWSPPTKAELLANFLDSLA